MHVVDTSRATLADVVREITDGRGADVVYEVTGTGKRLELAGACTRMSGQALHRGLPPGRHA
jgi:threonine dehydrogenase-like Zn-dependent dehydrogenase